MQKVTENTAIELLYRNKDINDIPIVDDIVNQYNRVARDLDLALITSEEPYSLEFNIPQYYKDIDIEEYIVTLIPQQPSAEIHGLPVNPAARVEEELALFKARNLYPVLQLMIYIVDTMRKYDIVWGVGRGSSVASYCLFLIGVHKIDSIKYNLDIKEFLK